MGDGRCIILIPSGDILREINVHNLFLRLIKALVQRHLPVPKTFSASGQELPKEKCLMRQVPKNGSMKVVRWHQRQSIQQMCFERWVFREGRAANRLSVFKHKPRRQEEFQFSGIS